MPSGYCLSCGSDVAGRDAAESNDEYRDLVAKAQAAAKLEDAVGDALFALEMLARPDRDDKRNPARELDFSRDRARESHRELLGFASHLPRDHYGNSG